MSLAQVCREQCRLAYHAPATALAVNMHLYWTGLVADLWRAGDTSLEWLLREAAAGAVFAAGHAESGNDLPLPPRVSAAPPAAAPLSVSQPRPLCRPASLGARQSVRRQRQGGTPGAAGGGKGRLNFLYVSVTFPVPRSLRSQVILPSVSPAAWGAAFVAGATNVAPSCQPDSVMPSTSRWRLSCQPTSQGQEHRATAFSPYNILQQYLFKKQCATGTDFALSLCRGRGHLASPLHSAGEGRAPTSRAPTSCMGRCVGSPCHNRRSPPVGGRRRPDDGTETNNT